MSIDDQLKWTRNWVVRTTLDDSLEVLCDSLYEDEHEEKADAVRDGLKEYPFEEFSRYFLIELDLVGQLAILPFSDEYMGERMIEAWGLDGKSPTPSMKGGVDEEF